MQDLKSPQMQTNISKYLAPFAGPITNLSLVPVKYLVYAPNIASNPTEVPIYPLCTLTTPEKQKKYKQNPPLSWY